MPGTFLLIGKNGEISETTVRTTEISGVHKKLLAKTPSDISLQTEWVVRLNTKKYKIGVYGKTTGRAGQENKYEFPPPIDNRLMFGKVAVVSLVEGAIGTLTTVEWDKIYDKLHGGFDDIEDEEEDEEDEEDEDEDEDGTVPRTKSGYAKDGFVVDDDVAENDDNEEEVEDEEDEFDDEDTTSDEEVETGIPVARTRSSKRIASKGTKKSKVEPTVNSWVDEYECTDELREEEYV